MQLIISAYLFMLGTACGSFGLVLADRMHSGADWVRGRSVCDHCGHKLKPIDLIPLISWSMQGGKCRYCQKSLSVFYPLVELGLGVAFALSYLLLPYELTGLAIAMFGLWLVGLVIMAALVVADLKWYLLPSKLVYPLTFVAALHWFIELIHDNQAITPALIELAAAMAVGAGLFWGLNKYSRGRWIGDGDYRLGVAMGFFLGEPLRVWMSLFFASLIGLLFALPIMIRTKKRSKIKIPYGPFLIIALAISYLYGQQLIDWYSNAFLYL